MDYQKQGIDFLEKRGVTITVKFLRNDRYFPGDKQARDIYRVTFNRSGKEYSFTFGQSIVASGVWEQPGGPHKGRFNELPEGEYMAYGWRKVKRTAPTAYDVLSIIEARDPGLFEDFCNEYGYDVDSRSAYQTYEAVRDQYLHLRKMFSEEELEEMMEIQ
jgi:hypothetical protein